MASYTYLNQVPVARVHKSNAREVAEDAAEMVAYYCKRLLVLAAMSPHGVDDGEGHKEDWGSYVMREVEQCCDELLEEDHKRWAAQYIVDNPDDCEDELEGV